MDVSASSLWIQTGLAVAGAVAGVLLHLKWHPLRRELSDAWDMMLCMPWLTVLTAVLMLLAEVGGERWVRPVGALNELLVWREMVVPLVLEALMMLGRLLHGLLPVWPLALLLPVALGLLSWRVLRFPYRYGPRRQLPVERWLLLAGMVLSWVWLGLEGCHVWVASLPEWLEALRDGLRLLFMALTMAICQVLLIRLVIAWVEPEHPDDRRDLGLAAEHTFARWRSLVALAVLDLLWLLLPAVGAPSGMARWLLLEALFVFAAVPVAVARVPGTVLVQGAFALQMLWRALPALVALALTAVAVLCVVLYASSVLMGLTVPGLWSGLLLPVHALVLATVRNWVFLAAVITLLRHGLKPSALGPAA